MKPSSITKQYLEGTYAFKVDKDKNEPMRKHLIYRIRTDKLRKGDNAASHQIYLDCCTWSVALHVFRERIANENTKIISNADRFEKENVYVCYRIIEDGENWPIVSYRNKMYSYHVTSNPVFIRLFNISD